MKKIALPVNGSKLCSQFEKCHEFLIITTKNKKAIDKEFVHSHLQPGLFPYWLANRGVTDIIVHDIDYNSINKFHQYKINVFVGVKTSYASSLMKEFMDGTLETNDILKIKYS